MAFTPRLNSFGIINNRHWYSTGNPYYPNWGMPNCTCYAWGRFWEIGDPLNTGANRPNPNDLPGGWSGGYWWRNVNTNVYQTGTTPALGAVICFWDSQGDGHVAIVEQINNDGESIVTSNSAWSGSFFYTMTLYRSNNYSWTGGNGHFYEFQGFIYNPYADTPTPPTPTEIKGSKFPWVLYANNIRNRQMLTK